MRSLQQKALNPTQKSPKVVKMSREIKFRIWRYCHGENKFKFYYLAPGRVGADDNDLVFSRVHKTGVNDYCDTSLRPLDAADRSAAGIHRVIVQQFTGLTDVKGNPIYEGDILAWVRNDSNAVFECVEFIDGGFCVVTNEGSYLLNQGRLELFGYIVVGNIFETPAFTN